MKKILSLAINLALVAVSASAARAFAGQGAGVAGTWDITIDSPQGSNKSTLVIKKDGDKLSGMIKGARGERPLESVMLSGSDITFIMKANVQGQDMVFTYKGKVEKDSMKGDADFGGFATGTWSAVPHKDDGAAPAAPASAPAPSGGTNISGDWSVTVETGGGSGTPSFTFKQNGENLTGSYKGQFGEAQLTGTLKGADIKFAFKIDAQGQQMTITYIGKVESKDSMKGTVSLGELGEGTWTGKRK